MYAERRDDNRLERLLLRSLSDRLITRSPKFHGMIGICSVVASGSTWCNRETREGDDRQGNPEI